MTTLALTPARVEIDATTHAHVFDALVRTDTRWNGWACPYFTLDTVRRIAAMVESDGARIEIDGGTVTVLIDYADGPEPEVIDPVDVDGTPMYPVGAWSWTWTEIDPTAPTDPAALDAWLDTRADRTAVYCAASNASNAARVAAGLPYDAAAVAANRAAGEAAVAAFDLGVTP